MFLPSMPSMVVDLGSSAAGVQFTLSVFMIAFGVAQLVWGPLSDRHGRRAALGLGLGLYVAASIGCWAAPTIETLIVFRALQAIGACCAPVVARAVVRDVFERDDMARVMSYVITTFAVIGIVAPALGAVIEETVGWRGGFAFMALVGAVLLATILAVLPETHPPSRREAASARRIVRNYRTLLTDRRHLGYALAGALSYSAYFVFSSVAAFVLIDVVGVSPMSFALFYAAVALGYGVGAVTSARLARRLGLDRTVVVGLVVSVAGSLVHNALALAGVFDAYAIALPMAVVAVGLGMVFANLQTGAIAPFPQFAGAASSMAGFLQMLVSSIVGAAVLQFYDGTQLAMTFGILFSATAMAGVYYVLVWRRLSATGSR
jgi:DHA1 family bicyclomycin/chloramphenicol resistance-like MFS transporter